MQGQSQDISKNISNVLGNSPDFNLSYENTSPRDGAERERRATNRITEDWKGDISRITGPKGGFDLSTSNFCDDSKMIELLQSEHIFDDIDMGQIDDEDRPFLLIDKDTGRVYDIRNENHLSRLQEKQTRLTSDISSSTNTPSSSNKAWSDWWKEKRRNNQDFLLAAEAGNIDEVKRLLNKEVYQDLVADINNKGLDQWTALHFAANEGRLEVVKELIKVTDIEIDGVSSILRTPLHLAAIRGHVGIIRVLVDAGAKKDARDFDENTPLHYASEYGNFESIIYLVREAYVDPMPKNKYGYTPSDIA